MIFKIKQIVKVKNISSNSIAEKNELSLNNSKSKNFDYRNVKQFNEINKESNKNEEEEIPISNLQLKIETLK